MCALNIHACCTCIHIECTYKCYREIQLYFFGGGRYSFKMTIDCYEKGSWETVNESLEFRNIENKR